MKIWFDSTRYPSIDGYNYSDCSCDGGGGGGGSAIADADGGSPSLPAFSLPRLDSLSNLVSQPLHLAPDLYIQDCNDGYRLVCRPTGSGQVTVMDADAFALLQSFQNSANRRTNTLAELQAIHLFLKLGFLSSGDTLAVPVRNEQREGLFAWIHLTNACNLSCHYCYVAKSSEHMADKTAQLAVDAVIRSALNEGYRSIGLTYAGGEASLRWSQLLALHDYAVQQTTRNDLRLYARLLSNGVALTRRAAEQLKQRGIQLTISLDGIGPAHDTQRPLLNGQGSFALVDRTISRLLEQQFIPSINATVSARNVVALPDLIAYVLERDLPFTLSYYRENDCSVVSLPRFDRVPKAELYLNQIRKGIINGKDPKGLQQRIQRGSRAAGSDERQADCPDCP